MNGIEKTTFKKSKNSKKEIKTMKKSVLWKLAMVCVINGDMADLNKVDVLEMMMDEMHMAVYREKEAAKNAEGEKQNV